MKRKDARNTPGVFSTHVNDILFVSIHTGLNEETRETETTFVDPFTMHHGFAILSRVALMGFEWMGHQSPGDLPGIS